MKKLELLTVTITVVLLVIAADARTLSVSTAEELYTAVNDGNNVGVTIVLAPGTYMLTRLDGAGQVRPNVGRLELQADMSLRGVVGDRSLVFIDASGLPNASLLDGTVRTGPIRIGRGSNSVEWLTIKGNSFAAGGIETDLPSTMTSIRIASIASFGSIRGLDIRSIGISMSDRTIIAQVVDSEFNDNAREGIRFVNINGVLRSSIRAKISGNRALRNPLGCIAENSGSSFSSVIVNSSGDRFNDNGGGCVIGAALIGGLTGDANDNYTEFIAQGSSFSNNTGRALEDSGGIVALGAETPQIAGRANNNRLYIRLNGCKVYGNQDSDLELYGARGILSSLDGFSGTNNHTRVELFGVSKLVENVIAFDSLPFEPAHTNTLTISGLR